MLVYCQNSNNDKDISKCSIKEFLTFSKYAALYVQNLKQLLLHKARYIR